MLHPARTLLLLCFVTACGSTPSQVSFVSNEQPSSQGAPQTSLTRGAAHQENPNGGGGNANLGDDEMVEPEHPAADTKQERALVHIHGPKGAVCSGVVVGPKLVATAQRCLHGQGQGATALGGDREYRVEVASSTLTWTNRKAKYAVLPKCDESDVDIAILVLDEPVPALVVPLKIVSAPDTGGRDQALGFGRCAGASASMKERAGAVRNRGGKSIVVDIPLCSGDVGGFVIDGRDGEVVGLISHRDDPEGSPLRTTTIARLDTTWARDLIAQAKQISEGADATKAQAIACR